MLIHTSCESVQDYDNWSFILDSGGVCEIKASVKYEPHEESRLKLPTMFLRLPAGETAGHRPLDPPTEAQ